MSVSTRLPRPVATALRSAPAQKVPPAPVRIATDSASSASNRRNASTSARCGRAVDGVAGVRPVDRDRRTPGRRPRSARSQPVASSSSIGRPYRSRASATTDVRSKRDNDCASLLAGRHRLRRRRVPRAGQPHDRPRRGAQRGDDRAQRADLRRRGACSTSPAIPLAAATCSVSWRGCSARAPACSLCRAALTDENRLDEATEVFNDDHRRAARRRAGRSATTSPSRARTTACGTRTRSSPSGRPTCSSPTTRPTRSRSGCEAWLGPHYQISAQVNRVNPGRHGAVAAPRLPRRLLRAGGDGSLPASRAPDVAGVDAAGSRRPHRHAARVGPDDVAAVLAVVATPGSSPRCATTSARCSTSSRCSCR